MRFLFFFDPIKLEVQLPMGEFFIAPADGIYIVFLKILRYYLLLKNTIRRKGVERFISS